ncbi:MAG: sigma-54-dependent Fis family transcriptional regulator [Gemmatimonadaceae bacterium]|nr:sigma-54-dependent Fis family transcriptional regulator [Gemmatimonadaceae bacterium]
MTSLVVVPWSTSFETLWPELAAASGVVLDVLHAPSPELLDALALRRDVIVVHAIGGVESTAIEALARHAMPANAVLVGAAGDHRVAVRALRRGAEDYFAMPGDVEALRSWIVDAVRRIEDTRAGSVFAAREGTKYTYDGILGSSAALRQALALAGRVIPHPNVTVLLTGETGTGKELFARAIHYNGPRKSQPFVEVNCTAIPDTLLESELFGHEAGAFTDARTAKPGLFELADGGTLFLDEIGHLPLALQGKLLRVLEERTSRRVGGTRSVAFDVRIIAATHVDLQRAVEQGAFREDLWYRLNVMTIELPPLRERLDDVVELAEAFVRRFAREYGIDPAPTLSPDALRVLTARPWPGNVREVRNVIERALLVSDGHRVEIADLSRPGAAPTATRGTCELDWPSPLGALVRSACADMVQRCAGNKSEAARRLGISRQRLQRLLEAGSDDETPNETPEEF